ncbi:MAG TPA: hypothetical protein DEF45_02125 [Rhodopirellula sp.]|nr:hypothetical protein [Rhodopirellula sp.]
MIRSIFGSAALVVLSWGCCVDAFAEGPGDDVPGRFDEYELLMLDRPHLTLMQTQELEFPVGLVELWMRALKRQEPELQRLIIDTMAMAFDENLQGLDVALEELVKLASADKQDLDVVRAAVQTLIVLDVRDQQQLFADLAVAKGAAVSEIVEPALANWRSNVMEDAWIGRVRDQAASPSQMMLAIKGLAAIGSKDANEALQSLVLNTSALRKLRMAAAQALGTLAPEEQLTLSNDFEKAANDQILDALLGLALIDGVDSAEAVAILQRYARHENSAVQSLALGHLYRVNYKLVLPYVSTLLGSRDVNVRRWCAKALVDGRNKEDVAALASFLNDLNPGLRTFVANSFVDFAEDQNLKPLVLSEVEKIIAGDNWRGCEQACVVFGKLDHEPSAEKMVELLGHPRGDVKVAAAWGLTQLRVAEVLPDMLDHAESIYEGLKSGELNARMPGVTFHLAHLCLAFGDQGYTAAEPLLLKLVPKSYDYGQFPRPAAVWSLGVLHTDDPEPRLVASMVERLQDDEGMVPEIELVRIMCAVSLGRMNAVSAKEALAEYAANTNMLASATRWGMEEITGEPVPLPPHKPTTNTKNQWFLTPLTP